jgi:hypothetical protein
MRRILLVFALFADAIIARLPARVPGKAFAREISSHESWQWGGLEDERVASGSVLLGQASKRPKVQNLDLS